MILVCLGVGSGSFCSVPEVLVTEVTDGSGTGQVSATNSTVGLFAMGN